MIDIVKLRSSLQELVNIRLFDLKQLLPLLQALEAASTAAGMLADYQADLKLALCQTDKNGKTVLAKLVIREPCLDLIEYLLIHGMIKPACTVPRFFPLAVF